MNGIKLANVNIDTAGTNDFSVDTDFPLWISDLKKNPKHYGYLKATVGTLAAFSTKTLLTVQHNYKKTPSFITQWYYPAGTSPGFPSNQFYGIGSVEAFTPSFDIVKFKAYVTPTRFIIQAENGQPAPISNFYVEFKYYIMAAPLSDKLIPA